MALVIRRYRAVSPVDANYLVKQLNAAAVPAVDAMSPGMILDVEIENTASNYSVDLDEAMEAKGFEYVTEGPVTTIEEEASKELPPAIALTETGGPTDLSIDAIADGHYLKRSGSLLTADAGPAPTVLEAFATGNVTTSSTAYVEIASMQLTGLAAGTYYVTFNANAFISGNYSVDYCLFYGAAYPLGTQLVHSERIILKHPDSVVAVCCGLITVAVGQQIEARVKVSNGLGTGTTGNRVIHAMKVA